MLLPKNLLTNTYTKPRLFLCETDKQRIAQLDSTALGGTFEFNAISEINFETARTYNDLLSGETKVNPFYNKVEFPRLVELEHFGFFEIQGPTLNSDGIKEFKSINAKSLEYTLAQKYLTNFSVNTGEIGSIEVTYAEEKYGPNYTPDQVVPVTFYNQDNKDLSLLHLILKKAYGWSIGYVDVSLQTLSRKFEVERESVYDLIINEICPNFNCYAVFDTINNTISFYAESLTSKFIGDGKTNQFVITPPFSKVGTVSIDGYKTTRWEYDSTTGILTLNDIPVSGSHIEVVDSGLEAWATDVFVTFDNLSQEINIDYDADSIKTVLTVTYSDGENIRETNLGSSDLMDLSYYYTVDWMGQELYDAYTKYLQKINEYQLAYTDNSQKMLEISNKIWFEENRLSLGYSIVQSVGPDTVGTYYVRGGDAPNYYYTEVTLPADYNANTVYYKIDTTNLTEEKVSNLYTTLKKYFNKNEDWAKDFTDESSDNYLGRDFQFMEASFNTLFDGLKAAEPQIKKGSMSAADNAVTTFLNEMWNEIGRTPLEMLYQIPYKEIQTVNIDAGWSDKDNKNYGMYYPVTLMLPSIEKAIAARNQIISKYEDEQKVFIDANLDIVKDSSMTNGENFTEQQLIRLNAFLREDELQLDDIITTDQDTLADTFKVKQDAMESGRIELSKLCQPQLQFSMSMANIYALPEFEPIINQFQLGNVIKVGLRSDYIKQSRLLKIDIDFEDFSNFSVEFGELTSLRSQSDIHADLLSKAIQAGKQVASSANIWQSGADTANSIDLQLQEGLLNSIEALKAADGTQNAYIDKYGIHLESIDPNTGEVSNERIWMLNNQIVFTDDGFKTSKAALGEFTVDGITYYGLLAQAVIAGLVRGSKIEGGTIKIGEQTDGTYAFEVHQDGSVTMNGGTSVGGSSIATADDIDQVQDQIDGIERSKMYRVETIAEGSTVISTYDDVSTLTCKVYSWDVDITDSLDPFKFSWKRKTSTGAITDEEIAIVEALDEAWGNEKDADGIPTHQGVKSIIITADDILENSSFTCEVKLPDIATTES